MNEWTDGPTDGWTDGLTPPHVCQVAFLLARPAAVKDFIIEQNELSRNVVLKPVVYPRGEGINFVTCGLKQRLTRITSRKTNKFIKVSIEEEEVLYRNLTRFARKNYMLF